MAYDRSPSKNIYLNVAVNTLKKLRGLVPSSAPGLNSKLGGGRGGGRGVHVWKSQLCALSAGPQAPQARERERGAPAGWLFAARSVGTVGQKAAGNAWWGWRPVGRLLRTMMPAPRPHQRLFSLVTTLLG